MRVHLILALCTMAVGLGGPAWADQSVAGYWQTDLGGAITIDMNVTADGQWNSTTAEAGVVVAEMAGDYRQTVTTPSTGLLVFTPHKAHVTAGHGAPKVERDTYQLSPDGEMLRLTASGDAMEFHKVTR